MTITLITSVSELHEGDLIRATRGDTVITGRVRTDGDRPKSLYLENLSTFFRIAYRLSVGWKIELLDRPVLQPPVPGLYILTDHIAPNGRLSASATLVSFSNNQWCDYRGIGFGDYHPERAKIETYYRNGQLTGPLRVVKSQRPD